MNNLHKLASKKMEVISYSWLCMSRPREVKYGTYIAHGTDYMGAGF